MQGELPRAIAFSALLLVLALVTLWFMQPTVPPPAVAAGATLVRGGILGKSLMAPTGETIGTVRELVVGPSDELRYALIEPARKQDARMRWVPWRALRRDGSGLHLLSSAPLASAPAFDPSQAVDLADSAWNSSIHRYFGIEYAEAGPAAASDISAFEAGRTAPGAACGDPKDLPRR